jgi:hypothetical protein
MTITMSSLCAAEMVQGGHQGIERGDAHGTGDRHVAWHPDGKIDLARHTVANGKQGEGEDPQHIARTGIAGIV